MSSGVIPAWVSPHDVTIIELFAEFLKWVQRDKRVAAAILKQMDYVPDDEDLERWENEGGSVI